MARRRTSYDKALLTVKVGAVVVISSCVSAACGNLVAPPSVEVCTTVTPADAEAFVTVTGGEGLWTTPVDEEGCSEVSGSSAVVEASADGYEDYLATVPLEGEDITHDIELVAVAVPGSDTDN
jgi:hypothetical protein